MLIIFIILFWYSSIILLATEFEQMELDFNLVTLLLLIFPIVNTVLWATLRLKRVKKD